MAIDAVDFLLGLNVTGRVSGGTLAQVLALSPTVVFIPDPTNGTCFQERTGAAATTPAGVGDPVGTIKSLTGAIYATAPSDAARAVMSQDGDTYYLLVDGVDDRYTIAPTVNLGATYYHVGAYRAVKDFGRPYGTSTISTHVIYSDNSYGWRTYTSAGASGQPLAAGDPTVNHIVTFQRISDAAASGRYDGVDGTSFDPQTMAGTLGLTLFSDRNTGAFNTWGGRFFGGVWSIGTLSVADRAVVEAYVASLGE